MTKAELEKEAEKWLRKYLLCCNCKSNCDNINCNHNDTKGLCCLFNPENCKYRQLQKENAELKADNEARTFAMAMSEKVEKQLREENTELKAKVCSSIDCEKAQKNGELCLGYGGDEDEPCERCKNCIKCETGYFQLEETEKDEQLTNAKEIIKDLLSFVDSLGNYSGGIFVKAEQFLKENITYERIQKAKYNYTD